MTYDWDKRMHEMILKMKGVQLEGLDEEKKQRRERENTNQSESNQHLKSHQIHNSSHKRHDAEHTSWTYKIHENYLRYERKTYLSNFTHVNT